MRVTQGMMTSNITSHINQSYMELDRLNTIATTQKKISRPSHDPVVASKGIQYRTDVEKIEQYKRNLAEGHTWMETSDQALDDVNKALQRMRELAVNAANDTNTPDEREKIAKEMESLRDHIATVANTKVGDKYIFSGQDYTAPAVGAPPGYVVNTPNNDTDVSITVADGVQVPINVKGSSIFDDMFTQMTTAIDAVRNGDGDTALGSLDAKISDVLEGRASIGARQNRLEMVESRIDMQEKNAKEIMSINEDVDIEVAIMDLKTQEAIHRVALSVGARIIQPSLMDFLR
ncbi:MAG: flagellar hook-associated protein FlgL [Bacilli bacterium]